MDAAAVWHKLQAIPGPGALERAREAIDSGEITKDDLVFIVATAAMFPLALADMARGNKW